jgi:hypothetical protein
VTFLEQCYIRWRESDDPLAKGPDAADLYGVYNDLSSETVRKLEVAWQQHQKQKTEEK